MCGGVKDKAALQPGCTSSQALKRLHFLFSSSILHSQVPKCTSTHAAHSCAHIHTRVCTLTQHTRTCAHLHTHDHTMHPHTHTHTAHLHILLLGHFFYLGSGDKFVSCCCPHLIRWSTTLLVSVWRGNATFLSYWERH